MLGFPHAAIAASRLITRRSHACRRHCHMLVARDAIAVCLPLLRFSLLDPLLI